MTVWGLNNCYMQQYPHFWGGHLFMPYSGSSIASSIFSVGSPRYDVFNNNVLGYTPPTNFSYLPQLNNPFNFMGQINFMPQFTLANLFTPAFTSSSNIGMLDFLITGHRRTSQNTITTQNRKTTSTISSTRKTSTGSKRRTTSTSNPTINKALEVARSQIGVKEINGSNNSAQINEYRNGVENGVPWCASFVSWCYGRGQNSNNNKTFGYSASSQHIRRQAESAGVYSKAGSGYTPKAGDLMILKYSENSGHIGIVESVNSDGTFNVIEGNTSNQVKRKVRSMNTDNLHGFVRMDEWLA